MFRRTQGAAERSGFAQAVQTQTDGVSLPLALLFDPLCSQDEGQALGAARHAARQRRGQHVDQVLPHAGEDEAGEHGAWRTDREESGCQKTAGCWMKSVILMKILAAF